MQNLPIILGLACSVSALIGLIVGGVIGWRVRAHLAKEQESRLLQELAKAESSGCWVKLNRDQAVGG